MLSLTGKIHKDAMNELEAHARPTTDYNRTLNYLRKTTTEPTK